MPLCPYCRLFVDRLTRDHIIPRAWGGTDRLWWDRSISNVRMCCERCNSLRGELGHCVGAMAAIRTIPTPHRHTAARETRAIAKTIPAPLWLWWHRDLVDAEKARLRRVREALARQCG